MKTLNLNKKIAAGLFLGWVSLTAPTLAQAQSLAPNSSLEFDDGPTAKIDVAALQEIKAYATNAKTDMDHLLLAVSELDDSIEIKNRLYAGIKNIICPSDSTPEDCTKNPRATLLLMHSLKAAVTLVDLIDRQSIQRGLEFTPQGTVDQQVRIMKQGLDFASTYYESDYSFIDGVIKKNEGKTNPKFVEFGVRLNNFILKMGDGLLNARSAYGMIRWSLAVLANYIGDDKEVGLAYASTRYNIATTLTEKEIGTGKAIYPDLVNGDDAPTDVECIIKIRHLKQLAQQSAKEMKDVFPFPDEQTQTQAQVQAQSTDIVLSEKTGLHKHIFPDQHFVQYTKTKNPDGSSTITNIQYFYGSAIYTILAKDDAFNKYCSLLGLGSSLDLSNEGADKGYLVDTDSLGNYAGISGGASDGNGDPIYNNYISKLVCSK